MKKEELVFIPVPGMGHLVSTIEFGKRLLDLDSRLSITVLVMKPLASNVDEYARSLTASNSNSRIRYIHLPQVEPPPSELLNSPGKFITVYIESHMTHVADTLIKLVSSNSVRLVGLVVDIFCTSLIDGVAQQLGIPSYLFFPSGPAFLGFALYLPTRHDLVGTEFKDSDPESIFPSYINPIPTASLPSFAFNKDGDCALFLSHARKFKETKGIIVNTFLELESHALNSLLTDDETPPVYAVGPLIDLKGLTNSHSDVAHRNKIMKWLDDQPPSSVVFLCFGSFGCFDAAQVKEIAVALERTGQRFLWSLRLSSPQGKFAMPIDYTNHEEILPQGFLERIGGRGQICGWAPQVEILAHQAIGGFVSHCGWNSILESLWYGVPIVTWPIYAEQQLNAFQMVRELGLAVEMKIDYRMGGGDLFLADEIERAIGCLMNGDRELRKRVKEMGEKGRMAVMDGGSSFSSCGRLIKDMLGNKS